jgi:hypothetical protein
VCNMQLKKLVYSLSLDPEFTVSHCRNFRGCKRVHEFRNIVHKKVRVLQLELNFFRRNCVPSYPSFQPRKQHREVCRTVDPGR